MAAEVDTTGPWQVTHSVLRCELAVDRVVVEHHLHVAPIPGAAPGPLVLDGRHLTTEAVLVDGRPAPDTVEDARTLTVPLDAGVAHVVTTRTVAVPTTSGDKGFVWRDGLLATNCEPQGFRLITWALDRPANRATYDVTLVAEPAVFPVMLANGDRVDDGVLDDGRHWVRFVDPVTKPTYLFAVVAGDLQMRSQPFTTRSGRSLTLAVAAQPDLIDGAAFALGQMAVAMQFDEATGGIEHDLDTLTFVAVPGYPDATEYHGLMFFNPSVLIADPRGHADDDLLLITANVAHEYGHHVRGNRVTVRTWGQLALKEGLTVLMGQNDVRRHLFGPAARILDVLDLRRLQFPEELTIGAPVVRGEVDDPTQLYTRTTYLKGAEIFGMMRTLLGAEQWADVFAAFLTAHDLGAAGVDDFVEVACRVAPAQADGLRAISRWFGRAGRPALHVAMGDGALTIRRTDALTDDPPVGIPVTLGFLSADGSPAAVRLDGSAAAAEHMVLLDQRERALKVEATGPVVMAPLRGYSAPVDLAVDATDDALATVLLGDPDAVARWWAAETLMTRVVDAHRSGADAAAVVDVLAGALREVMRSEQDPLLLAQLLNTPDEFMLGDREARIDVDGISGGLAHLRSVLGGALHDPLLDVLARFGDDDPAGTAPGDIARRWLVEPCLNLLLATGSTEARDAAEAQLASVNDTRAVRALGQLLHVDSVDADDLIARTYARWQHAPKLVDRWLRAQTGARRGDTIQRVRTLVDSPLYDREDRSRVMAVWFPFATRNRSVFHDPSGAGYRTFVDEVLVLMPINAGLVVRLVGDLLQFRRFDGLRQALLRGELERMADAPGMPAFAAGIVRHLLDG